MFFYIYKNIQSRQSYCDSKTNSPPVRYFTSLVLALLDVLSICTEWVIGTTIELSVFAIP